jgi:hypothetical protein
MIAGMRDVSGKIIEEKNLVRRIVISVACVFTIKRREDASDL